jgi:peptidoglycan/xylan/chitin deacetylase (PgdA/CDA1 family)
MKTRLITLIATIAVLTGSSALPPDVPDPYGIVTQPIPEKLVVLTFDDSVASHATVAAPLLKKLGFGASFFICDYDSFKTRKDWYMTWEQIKSLADNGFDVGNHTMGHGGASIDRWLAMEEESLGSVLAW